MDDALRESARLVSRAAYVAAIRDLPDQALEREFKILEHTPELREDLEAEMLRRQKRKGAGA